MESGIPQHHPLRRLFNALTERSFSEKLGWPDLNITQYVANLLVEFTHTNQLYKVRNQRDQRVDTVIDLLYESEVLLGAQSLDRERDVHQHIGDFTLFMAGLFPEYLKRLKTAELIYHKDFLVDYMKTGKRSYGMVAEFHASEADERSPLFRKLRNVCRRTGVCQNGPRPHAESCLSQGQRPSAQLVRSIEIHTSHHCNTRRRRPSWHERNATGLSARCTDCRVRRFEIGWNRHRRRRRSDSYIGTVRTVQRRARRSSSIG